ncbi:MAG: glycosyltransferase [Bacteroidales bacterium]|nr:glycosyltransferase [Bacteroidales bacterium]
MKETPLVSIGIASYNNATYIGQTLDSIKNQSYPNIELIIVDDSSTDNSKETITNWLSANNYPANFIVNTENVGLSRVSNIILNNSNGKYYQILGSDDFLDLNKISKQLELLEKDPDTSALIYSDALVIDSNDEIHSNSIWKYFNNYTNPMPEGYIFKQILSANFIPALSVLVRTEYAKAVEDTMKH